ncbi:MAG: helix-turn-helix domain-containing protein [Deltaproteobacteria bacterium]|nr:helix-turn-helix domain-containing protein [Deltaproteobacteria bacterium]
MEVKRLFTVAEAAHYLGIPRKRIYNALAKKAPDEQKALFPVKAKRYGKYWLFEKRDLDAFADEIPYFRSQGNRNPS